MTVCAGRTLLPAAFASCIGLAAAARGATVPAAADLLLTNARVYTFSWDEPGRDGAPLGGVRGRVAPRFEPSRVAPAPAGCDRLA
jgi:hypothetical protein